MLSFLWLEVRCRQLEQVFHHRRASRYKRPGSPPFPRAGPRKGPNNEATSAMTKEFSSIKNMNDSYVNFWVTPFLRSQSGRVEKLRANLWPSVIQKV